jgi:hypothetical protein
MARDPRLYLCCHELPELEVSPSFALARFTSSVKACRSRPLYAVPLENGASFTTASIIARASDLIVYRSQSPTRDIQAVVHQTAHILLGHRGILLNDAMLGHLLFPGLNAVLTKCGLSSDDLDSRVGTADEERQARALTRNLLQRGETAIPEQPAA